MTIRQNIFHQIFAESVSVKISPCQNFVLYGIAMYLFNPINYEAFFQAAIPQVVDDVLMGY